MLLTDLYNECLTLRLPFCVIALAQALLLKQPYFDTKTDTWVLCDKAYFGPLYSQLIQELTECIIRESNEERANLMYDLVLTMQFSGKRIMDSLYPNNDFVHQNFL